MPAYRTQGCVRSRGCSYNFAVGKNCGARRALVACSNAKANLINVASLQARPKNDNPTGNPKLMNARENLYLSYFPLRLPRSAHIPAVRHAPTRTARFSLIFVCFCSD